MPNLWRKKNKSYGVGKESQAASLSAVRPLSAAFGTNELWHLDEDEAASKKAKVRDRGASKSTKGSITSNSRSRSTSVPARPKSTAFGSHFLPQSHIAEAKPPKRSESPVTYGKPRLRLDQDPFLHGDKLAEPELVKAEGRTGRKISNSGSLGGSGKLTVIRYTDKSMSQSGDLWKSPASHETEHSKELDTYQTVYQVLNPVQDRSDSIESLPESPFPREPSIRVATNSYHAKKSFSTFAAEDDKAMAESTVNGYTSFAKRPEHIYDEPTNSAMSQRNSLKKDHHYDEPASLYDSKRKADARRVPPPPRRSTSLQFEDVAIPTEQYHPLSSFVTSMHRRQTSSSEAGETSEPQIVHLTHESTKSPGVTECDRTTPPTLTVNNPAKSRHLSNRGEETDTDSSRSGREGKDTDSNVSESTKPVGVREQNYIDSVLGHSASQVNGHASDMSDTSSGHFLYEMSDMDTLKLEGYSAQHQDHTENNASESGFNFQEKSVLKPPHDESFNNKHLNSKTDDVIGNTVIGSNCSIRESITMGQEVLSETASESSSADTWSSSKSKTESDTNDTSMLSNTSVHPSLSTGSASAAHIKTWSSASTSKTKSDSDSHFTDHTVVVDPSVSQVVYHENVVSDSDKEKRSSRIDQVYSQGAKDRDFTKGNQDDTTSRSQCNANGTPPVDSVHATSSLSADLMSCTNATDKGSVSDTNTDTSVNNDCDATLTNKLMETDKENLPPKSNHHRVDVLAMIHSFNVKDETPKEDKFIGIDIPERNAKDIDFVSKELSGSEHVFNAVDGNKCVGTSGGLNFDMEVTKEEHKPQDEKLNSQNVHAVTTVTKPTVPLKPKKFSDQEDKKTLPAFPGKGPSSATQRNPTGLLAPTPFLSKPNKFVPSKLLTGNSSDSSVASEKEHSASSSVDSGKVSALIPVIKPFKSVPFSSVLVAKKGRSVSVNESDENSEKDHGDGTVSITRQKPTLAVKPQFTRKTSEVKDSELTSTLTSGESVLSKPVIPLKPSKSLYTDSCIDGKRVQSDNAIVSGSGNRTVSPQNTASVQHTNLNSETQRPPSAAHTLSVDPVKNNASFLDSLKQKHMVKKEPSFKQQPVVIKDDVDFGVSDVKETLIVTSEYDKPTAQKSVDVSSFLDDLKTGKKKSLLSPRLLDKQSGDTSADAKNQSDKEEFVQKPLANLTLEPATVCYKTENNAGLSEPATVCYKTENNAAPDQVLQPTVSSALKVQETNKRLSIKDMLINDICDLPETSVDTDQEWDDAPEGQNSSAFSGLKSIDTMSNREHTADGVLSPRQLKRSKGRFSRGSSMDQKLISVVKRQRRLSSDSCSDKESISDSHPESISKTSHTVSIQSENSAFQLVKSDDDADTSLDMVADIPEEFQVQDVNAINSTITTSTSYNVDIQPSESSLMTEVQVPVTAEIGGLNAVLKGTDEKPIPPPRRNQVKRHRNKLSNMDSSSFSNSDKSSSKQSSAISSGTSTNKELAQIEQSQQARFIPLGSQGYFDGNIYKTGDDVSEPGVCMPWDNAPWEATEDETFVIAPSEFRTDDNQITPPFNVQAEPSDEPKATVSEEFDNQSDRSDVNEDFGERRDGEHTFPQLDDLPSPRILSSPEPQDTCSETERDSESQNRVTDYVQESIIPRLDLAGINHSTNSINNETITEDSHGSGFVVPWLNLEEFSGDEPPSPFEANAAVARIFDETVRLSARYTARTEKSHVATSPRSVPSSEETSNTVSNLGIVEVAKYSGHFAEDTDDVNEATEQNGHFRFERNAKGLRSPIVSKRPPDCLTLKSDSSTSSSSSKYSERAIDIQDLDTDGKPSSISKHYEERAVDIDGLERASLIRSPMTPAQRRQRKENRLSDSGSSQLSKHHSSNSLQNRPQNHPHVPNVNVKDTTDSETSSNYSHTKPNPYSKKDSSIFVFSDTENASLKEPASPVESLSPTTPQSVCVSDISDIKPNPRDLATINLPGLKLSQEMTGPLKGSGHLHPALERSLRTNMVPQRMTGGEAGAHTALTEAGMPVLGSELMILVEEDYMTPRPGYNHAVMQNKEIPEPWTFDMVHNVRQSLPGGPDPETVGGSLLHRQDSMLSQASSTTTVTNNQWKTRPVERWGNEDLVDWAEAAGFEELADALHGTGIGGSQFLQFQEKTLEYAVDESLGSNRVDLGLINKELRQEILVEVNKLKEQPQSSAPLWTLKQASVRRKNLEASSNALKSRLTSLQQLNSKQEEQIQSYLQELKDHQVQTDLLINSPPPSVDGFSDSTLDNVQGRHALARLSSICTDVSAVLPPLSLTESEFSTYDIPTKPLLEWDNPDVLQWLAASGLYMFSHLFFTHKVTGRQLSEISMQFLDRIGIEKLGERELLLSKLYELQHAGEPSLEEVLRGHSDATSKPRSGSSVSKTGGSLKSTGSNNSSSMTRDRKRSSVVMGTRVVSKDLSRESPWTPASHRKLGSLSVEEKEAAENNVMIWHQLGGTMTSSYIRVKDGTSCYDAIQNLLKLQRVTDDSNLFYVVDRDFSGREVEVNKSEDMAALQRKWDNPVGHKLELRQRSGVQIKVFYKTPEGNQRTKSFRIAMCSSYSEVLLVTCKKFRVKRPGEFMLLDFNRSNGAVSQIPAMKNISELLTDSFILCEKTELTQASHTAALLKRRASSGSQDSSNLSDTESQATVTSSHFEQVGGLQAEMVEFDTSLTADSEEEDDDDTEARESRQIYPATAFNRFYSKSSHNITGDDFAKPPNITQLKPLHRNFRSMDDADFVNGCNDIPPRRVFSANDELDRVHKNSPDALELLQELALLKESLKERDIAMMDMKSENKELKTKSHDAVFTQNRLKSLETMYAEKQEQWTSEVSRLQDQLSELQQQQLERDPQAKLRHLEASVEQSRANVWQQEEEVVLIKQELEEQAAETRSDSGLVEYLQSQLNQSESMLHSLKQEHGDLLLQLEHTRKKQQKKAQEVAVDLFALIGSDKPLCLHALELEPKNGSYGLMIGRDSEKRLMVRHTEEGRPIIKGDRLIEVNGRLVAKLEDDEIANFLKNAKEKNGPLQIVVLREQEPMKDHVTKEEHEQLKEDYSLAMMEVESLQQENKDLQSEVQMLNTDFEGAVKEKDQLWKRLDQLKVKTGSLSLTDSDFAEASPHKRLQLMLDTINAGKPQNQAVTASQLRRGASRRGLDWFSTLVSVDRLDQVLAYDELDEKLPLYESMKIAPKEDVLQALKDTILETKQQKAYLDKLMALVIDHSPFLLKFVDASMGLEDDLLSIKSRTEEKC